MFKIPKVLDNLLSIKKIERKLKELNRKHELQCLKLKQTTDPKQLLIIRKYIELLKSEQEMEQERLEIKRMTKSVLVERIRGLSLQLDQMNDCTAIFKRGELFAEFGKIIYELSNRMSSFRVEIILKSLRPNNIERKSLQTEVLHSGSSMITRYTLLPRVERWTYNLSFWIPRHYRDCIRGDLFEDIKELQEFGSKEWRIRIHILWQLAICIVTTVPEAIISKIASSVRQIIKE